ncbi:hypothetical protein HK100_000840 [Physocladia obscura]|uniref:Ras-GEF domain-containing protein n=1 Tax=Physocladia obscura TaxID=109957 RepID=A0AAD5T3T5_9FUNG|nr:hypothetical protein HK100_000840 [Physocladia obscura]
MAFHPVEGAIPSNWTEPPSPPAPDTSSPKYIRVFISNAGSTVIQVTQSMPFSEILNAVCAKRQLTPGANLKLSIVHRNGTENNAVDHRKRLADFSDVDFIKLVDANTNAFAATGNDFNGTVSHGNLSRVSGVYSGGASGGSAAGIFGSNSDVLVKGREEMRIAKNNNSSAFNIGTGGGSTANLLKANMFKKTVPSTNDVVSSFKGMEVSTGSSGGTASGRSSVERLKQQPNQRQLSTSQLYQEVSNPGTTSLSAVAPDPAADTSILSNGTAGIASTSSIKRQDSVSSSILPESRPSYASGVEKMERSDSAQYVFLVLFSSENKKKRKPAFLSKDGTTLKKLSIRPNRSRSNTAGIQEVSKRLDSTAVAAADIPDKQYATLLVTLPNFRSITIRAPTDSPLDAILEFICMRHEDIDFDSHTFQRNDAAERTVEMDRTLGSIVNELKVEEVFIVPEAKVYRSTYFSEDGVDILMMQTIQGRCEINLSGIEWYFMPAEEFFRQLVSRYNCVPPENGTAEELEYYSIMKIPIQKCDREMTPYLNFFIDRFDKESYWVATEVVMQKDAKKRVAVLSKFILTTKACQEANNFFSLFSLMSGLGLSPVSRLKKTWEALPEKSKAVYSELEKIIDPSRNMKNYRDLLAKAVPPIVPFLPIYLKDLTFMNDGNAKYVENMINFDKLRMMGNRVKDIVSLVAVEYKGEEKPPIQNYISKPPVEKNMSKLKEMSLECEKSEK